MPAASGGHRMRCSTPAVSWTVPSTMPGLTSWPRFRAAGWKRHFFSRFSEGRLMPRSMKLPERLRISSSGRWMPS